MTCYISAHHLFNSDFLLMTRDCLNLDSFTCNEGGPHRTSSRSLSWNSLGSFLALAGSDRIARMFTVENGATTSIREVLVIPHSNPVTKVRFNPLNPSQLITAASDKVVRIWDIRGATQRSLPSLHLVSGNSPVSVEWCPTKSHVLSVTEQDGVMSIYDVRILNATSASQSNSTTGCSLLTSPQTSMHRVRPGALCSFSTGCAFPESCIFSPCGNFLVSDSNCDRGMCRGLRIWAYEKALDHSSCQAASPPEPGNLIRSYPSHAPLFALQFSQDGSFLASGGSDATVGLWDSKTMICRHSIARHLKFVRSVSISPDSILLASSSEEMIDIIDASSSEASPVGQISSSGLVGSRTTGAEEIAFHPKESYVLACARNDGPISLSPLSILNLNMSVSS